MGNLISGAILLDRSKNYPFFFVFGVVLLMAIGQALITWVGNVYVLFVDVVIVGYTFGVLHSGIDVSQTN